MTEGVKIGLKGAPVDDLVLLDTITEDAIIANLKQNFEKDKICARAPLPDLTPCDTRVQRGRGSRRVCPITPRRRRCAPGRLRFAHPLP